MSANLAIINSQTAMAYLDDTPWHGTGNHVLKLMRTVKPEQYVDVALDAAQMRFKVGSMPMYLADGTQIGGFKASVRFDADGRVEAQLGVVGEAYCHVQNEEAVALLRVMAKQFGCVPATAGVLGKGERCWMLMRLADAKLTVVPGDDVNGYFLLEWGHDGNMSVRCMATGVRVVCQNTLTLATAGRKAWISIRHTASAGARLDEAAKLIERMMTALKATGETFADMARKAITADQIVAYIDKVIPNTSASVAVAPIIMARRETVARLVHAGRGAQMANQLVNTSHGGASVWAVYNALTEYVDHVRPAEAASPEGRLKAQQSAIFGGNADLKVAALEQARQLVAA
jgi:phage/plasmid-like protein (TIGR03299 family)